MRKNKDYSKMTLTDAVEWAEKNASFADVRKRLASRQTAYLLLNALRDGAKYVKYLEETLEKQSSIIEEQHKRIENLLKFVPGAENAKSN